MPAKDSLFLLIHSLSKTEKRYFKVNYAQKGEGSTNYLRLFDAINKMQEYDEPALAREFKGEKLFKNLVKEKSYLYKAILKSMRAYRKDKSSMVKIRELLADAAFLRERSLYEQCGQVLQKAKKLAQEYEHFAVLLEILLQERELLKNLKPRKGEEMMKLLTLETQQTLEALNKHCHFLELYDELFFITLQSHQLRNNQVLHRLNSLMESPMVEDTAFAQTFRDQHRQLSIKAMNALLQSNPEEAHNFNKALVELWRSNQKIREENIYKYRNLLSNLLSSSFSSGKTESVLGIIEELKKIPPKNHHDEGTFFKHVYLAQLNYHISEGELDKARDLVPHIEKGLAKHHVAIGESRILTFNGNIAILFFLLDDYGVALDWVDRILNSPRSQNRKDIQRFARLFKLILHYEDDNPEFLESLLRSTSRYVKSLEEPYRMEKIVLKAYRKILGSPASEKASLFRDLAGELSKIKDDEKESKALVLEIFDLWADAMAKGISVRQLYIKRKKELKAEAST